MPGERDIRQQLEGALRDTRDELAHTLSALRRAASAELDWREWVRRHPLPSLMVAAIVGLRLGRGRWL